MVGALQLKHYNYKNRMLDILAKSLPSLLMAGSGKTLKMLLGFAVFVIFAAILIVAINPSSQLPNQPVQQQNQAVMVFDVPALVGMNIDQVRQVLGTPQDGSMTEPTAQQLALGMGSEWNNSFEKDGHTLLVTYNAQTRVIADFFVDSNDPSGATSDKAGLLAAGNLREGDSRYSIEFVQARGAPSQFTGVIAKPK